VEPTHAIAPSLAHRVSNVLGCIAAELVFGRESSRTRLGSSWWRPSAACLSGGTDGCSGHTGAGGEVGGWAEHIQQDEHTAKPQRPRGGRHGHHRREPAGVALHLRGGELRQVLRGAGVG
jgi:hypothetical protein